MQQLEKANAKTEIEVCWEEIPKNEIGRTVLDLDKLNFLKRI
jgi:hypothetical protein